MGCLPGEYAAFDGVAWGCADSPDVALAAIEARVATCETDLGALAARVTAAEGSLVTLEGRVTTGEGARADLDARLGAVEGSTTGLTTLAYTARFSDLVAVPGDLADGDDDTLAALACADGQIPVYTLATRVWDCGDDTDTTLTPAEVRAIVRATGIDLAAGSTIGGRTPRFSDEPDTLTALSCGDGEIPRWDALLNAWTCDVDRALTEADVDAMVADNGYASASSVTVLGGRVTTAEGTLATLDGRVTTAEGTLATLGSTVSGHTSTLASHTSTLASHGSRLGALEGASDADTLGGLSCADGEEAAWDAILGDWTCAEDAVRSVADVIAAVAGQIVAPSRVEVGNTRVTDGTLDLGTASDDSLTAAMVRTLTGGGDADALHTHAGAASGGGACYTAWGTTSCGTGFTAMYTGWGMSAGNASSAFTTDMFCTSTTSLTLTSSSSGYLNIYRVGTQQTYNSPSASSAGTGISCAVCCK